LQCIIKKNKINIFGAKQGVGAALLTFLSLRRFLKAPASRVHFNTKKLRHKQKKNVEDI